MKKYYSFNEANKIMRTGQVMGGGAEFDYYFMIGSEVYGGFSCDYDRYQIDLEKEQAEKFYVIHDMTIECYLRWMEEGLSEVLKLAERRSRKMAEIKTGFRAVLFNGEVKIGNYPIRPTYKQAVEDIEYESKQVSQHGGKSEFTHACVEELYYRI